MLGGNKKREKEMRAREEGGKKRGRKMEKRKGEGSISYLLPQVATWEYHPALKWSVLPITRLLRNSVGSLINKNYKDMSANYAFEYQMDPSLKGSLGGTREFVFSSKLVSLVPSFLASIRRLKTWDLEGSHTPGNCTAEVWKWWLPDPLSKLVQILVTY